MKKICAIYTKLHYLSFALITLLFLSPLDLFSQNGAYKNDSIVTYNHGQSKKLGHYTFEPGVKEKAFSQEFDTNDNVGWTVEFSDGATKTVDTNINSNNCRNPSLFVTPIEFLRFYLP